MTKTGDANPVSFGPMFLQASYRRSISHELQFKSNSNKEKNENLYTNKLCNLVTSEASSQVVTFTP